VDFLRFYLIKKKLGVISKNYEKSPIHIAGGLKLIIVATKSTIRCSFSKLIAGWDRTD
jgi:hypothetical protein